MSVAARKWPGSRLVTRPQVCVPRSTASRQPRTESPAVSLQIDTSSDLPLSPLKILPIAAFRVRTQAEDHLVAEQRACLPARIRAGLSRGPRPLSCFGLRQTTAQHRCAWSGPHGSVRTRARPSSVSQVPVAPSRSRGTRARVTSSARHREMPPVARSFGPERAVPRRRRIFGRCARAAQDPSSDTAGPTSASERVRPQACPAGFKAPVRSWKSGPFTVRATCPARIR